MDQFLPGLYWLDSGYEQSLWSGGKLLVGIIHLWHYSKTFMLYFGSFYIYVYIYIYIYII